MVAMSVGAVEKASREGGRGRGDMVGPSSVPLERRIVRDLGVGVHDEPNVGWAAQVGAMRSRKHILR